MSSYIRKTDGLARELAPQLPILTRISDMYIDMDDCGRGPSKPQLARLAKLTAEAYAQAERGQIQLFSVFRPSAATPKSQWYGRDEKLFPLPSVTPRTYRIGRCRVGGSHICGSRS